MRTLVEIAAGVGAGLIFIFAALLWFAPSHSLDFIAKIWRTWRGKREAQG